MSCRQRGGTQGTNTPWLVRQLHGVSAFFAGAPLHPRRRSDRTSLTYDRAARKEAPLLL